MAPQRRRWGLCGCTHATQRPSTCHLCTQHACESAKAPRITSGAGQSNRTNGTSATPLGPVWVYARYPTTKYMSSVDAACVHDCGGPTHNERRRAIKSHEWRFSDAAGACVGVRTLPNDQVHVICRCSMRVRVRRAHARRAAPGNQIARMAPQRRRWGLCGCTHATQRPSTCHLSTQHVCTGAKAPRITSGAGQSNRTNGTSATPLGPVWVYARY
jgi:hypothetical protein